MKNAQNQLQNQTNTIMIPQNQKTRQYHKNTIDNKPPQMQLLSGNNKPLDTYQPFQALNIDKIIESGTKQINNSSMVLKKIDEKNKKMQNHKFRSKSLVKISFGPKNLSFVPPSESNSNIQMKITNIIKQFQNQLDDKTLIFSMKRTKFFQILKLFSQNLVDDSHFIKIQSQKQNILLKNLCQKLSKLIQLKNSQKGQRLHLQSHVFDKKYTQNDFSIESTTKTIKIIDLNSKLEDLTLRIIQKQEMLHDLQSMYFQRQKKCIQDEQKHLFISQQLQAKRAELQNKQNQIKYQENILKIVEEKTQNITKFVQIQQQKPIFRWTSQACQRYQMQINQNGNEIAKELKGESFQLNFQPFKQIQKQIWRELDVFTKEITLFPVNSEKIETQITQFITTSLDKFKEKNSQIFENTKTKIHTINNFLELMRNWMQNFDLKQHFLVGLRNEFVALLQTIQNILVDLQIKEENQFKSQKLKYFIELLKSNWAKISLNYKYTNSFI